ncbi:uncharacterized protein N7525_003926 [Penicillium rubens]|uniref:uncharacterized protein n=1 Tax=Penicillium rubens TaxID=1108849 RepID=UPI002A59EE71|nr:uncharacterized protein N7525_003926 [Penicillium rubens]KAJ5838738.1 hypothetical protein N7525_003926 [Penicillium rubens]KAJ5866788.1 hypothetical protein N7534_001341 [Penicillium rubens]
MKCCDAQEDRLRYAAGIVSALCAAMHHSWALRILGVGKTVAQNVILALKILGSETIIERLAYPKSANPVPPTNQGLGSNSMITSRHANLHHFCIPAPCTWSQFGPWSSPPLFPNVPYTEYAFIELLSLPSEDVAYLSSDDCFTLPGTDALNEFIQEYFKRVHSLVPVLDEAEFFNLRVPKYLFSCCNRCLSPAFASLEKLRECWFNDMREALKQLYNRANCHTCRGRNWSRWVELLFQLRAEEQSHANAQGAVLLTLYTSAQEPQAGSLWLTKAIEYAVLMNAQLSPSVENVAISLSLEKRL